MNGDNRVLREIDILIQAGHSVRIICYDFGSAKAKERKDLDIKRIKISKSKRDKLLPLVHRFPLFNRLWTNKVKQEVEAFTPDYVIAHDLYMALPVKKGITLSGHSCRLVLDLHENYPEAVKGYNWTQGKARNWLTRPEEWKKKEKEYLNLADQIIVLHDSFKATLESKYPETKGRYTIFPNIPDIGMLNNQNSDSSQIKSKLENPIMFYFGAVARRRGIFESLDVFKRHVEQGGEGNYLIIGPIDKADRELFKAKINDPIVTQRIEYLPWIDIKELPSYLEHVDICVAPFEVNPQHESGVANKIFQYMYGAKPIIASNCKPQADLINTHNCGIIYKNESEFLAAMETLFNDDQGRKEMGRNGKIALNETYHIDQLKKPFLAIFDQKEVERG